MTCPFCKAAPRSDWGYECGTGPDANKQRSVRCRDAEIAMLRERIKRLEEAGDLMVQHFYTDEPRSEMWEKAKEAKP